MPLLPPLPAELSALLRAVGRWTADTLLPPRCLGCGVITDQTGTLCPDCWRKVTLLGPPACPRCGHPFTLDPGPGAVCGPCAAQPPRFERARAVLRYDDGSRPLILRFKHGDRVGAAPHLARWMVRAGADLLAEADVIVPEPLHRWRLLQRRFNQSALLAKAIARQSGRPWLPDTLRRARYTLPQGRLNARDRRRNVQGAFRVTDPDRISGRRVLLVDDVLTSGATIDACVATLLRAGATAVDVLTLARVVLTDIDSSAL